jgi:hypothetical protein
LNAEAPAAPKPVIEDSIEQEARAGFGVSIVPEMARSLSEGCRLIEIEPKASRRVGYIRLELRYLSKAPRSFHGTLEIGGREAEAVTVFA